MKQKWVDMYLDFALRLAEESHAVRLKVGAVFVSPEGVISTGINGLPAGGSNVCEVSITDNIDSNNPIIRLVTKPEVSHAEEALFSKLMKQGVSTKDGRIFLTHAPCINCSKMIIGAGVTYVHYLKDYRSIDGVAWLLQNDVEVIKESHAAI